MTTRYTVAEERPVKKRPFKLKDVTPDPPRLSERFLKAWRETFGDTEYRIESKPEATIKPDRAKRTAP